jgi:hypothetical protein
MFIRNKNYGIGVTTGGITFILSFIKIGPPGSKVKMGTTTQRSYEFSFLPHERESVITVISIKSI